VSAPSPGIEDDERSFSSARHEDAILTPRRLEPSHRLTAADGGRRRRIRPFSCDCGGRVLLLLHRGVSLHCGVLQSRTLGACSGKPAHGAGGRRWAGSGSTPKLRNDPGYAPAAPSRAEEFGRRSSPRIATGDRIEVDLAGISGDSVIRRRESRPGQPPRPSPPSLPNLKPTPPDAFAARVPGRGGRFADSRVLHSRVWLVEDRMPNGVCAMLGHLQRSNPELPRA
jgi:hypothetical protein